MYAVLVVRSRTLFFQRRPAVTLNGIDPDDVSFRIRSPHRAEASLLSRSNPAVADTFLLKKARRRAAGCGGSWLVIKSGATRRRAWAPLSRIVPSSWPTVET